jgi:RNA polymerase sigma factor (sigma-70 family)
MLRLVLAAYYYKPEKGYAATTYLGRAIHRHLAGLCREQNAKRRVRLVPFTDLRNDRDGERKERFDPPSPKQEKETTLEVEDLLHRLEALLPPRTWQIVRERCKGRKMEAIARDHGISAQAVSQQLEKARRRARRLLSLP